MHTIIYSLAFILSVHKGHDGVTSKRHKKEKRKVEIDENSDIDDQAREPDVGKCHMSKPKGHGHYARENISSFILQPVKNITYTLILFSLFTYI